MAVVQHPEALLGLEIGSINTRVSLFGITDGKYRLLGSHSAATSLGQDLHIGVGVGQALQVLQQATGHLFLNDSGGLLIPVDRIGRGVDHVAMVTSAGQRVNAAVLGLTSDGSLRAGTALIDCLPLKQIETLGLVHLADEIKAIEMLIRSRPEIIIITGGEDGGAEISIQRWIEIVRTACRLMPSPVKPVILYAGNPQMESTARRRLEPVSKLQIAPNLQPGTGHVDLVPAQILLEREILTNWKSTVPGLREIVALSQDLSGLTARALDRMIRYLSQTRRHMPGHAMQAGVLAVDLGGAHTTVAAGLNGLSATVVQDKFFDLDHPARIDACQEIKSWSAEPVSLEEADQFLCNHALIPAWVPETRKELALAQAFARYQLRQALGRLAENTPWFEFNSTVGLQGYYEPIIASGAVLTAAPDPEGVMLTLLDGLQPRGITTFVLDRHHLLPLLGKIGQVEPVLPAHLLSSAAFVNLGTVISVVGDLPKGKAVLTVRVGTQSGTSYTADIHAGTLTRLEIPAGEVGVIELVPHRQIDVGFGGCGQGGKLKVTGGTLGVVIDARGRPVQLPAEDGARNAMFRQWLENLGADRE